VLANTKVVWGEGETVKLCARLLLVCMELGRKRREKKIAEWDKAQNVRELKEDGELAELKRTNA
jgi:hypothetical protein